MARWLVSCTHTQGAPASASRGIGSFQRLDGIEELLVAWRWNPELDATGHHPAVQMIDLRSPLEQDVLEHGGPIPFIVERTMRDEIE